MTAMHLIMMGEHKYMGGDTRRLDVEPAFATTSCYPVYKYELNGKTYLRADYIMTNESDCSFFILTSWQQLGTVQQ